MAAPKRIVLTGGPGAGKTATLEVVRHHFSAQVHVLPEAAGILYGGGFPRHSTNAGSRAAQRAIFHVQRELERGSEEERIAETIVCDRGTLDGLAYWPGAEDDFFRDVETSIDAELARYAMVVHLRTPSVHDGYNHENPLRIESARQAAAIDARIGRIWSRHPRVVTVESRANFVEKVHQVLDILRREIPTVRARTRHPEIGPDP
ncbi:hypothetical protein AKJ09_02046 [Labilithrix luteola]|uniref:NadR/Ttd14 AAA domain-containing protein n=1 Tax=Labilithrix luteola TaxID=1391654 RepID=A0A0K1PPE3_9BACT|nr:ATP-binding protein [Labilithrix luteola]AKU95382.1 hypothetical protein AKJ09_02046 [Labilithrix luteola]